VTPVKGKVSLRAYTCQGILYYTPTCMSPIEPAVLVLVVFLASRIRAEMRAAAVRRAERSLSMLHRVAELTELRLGDTAALLGATREQVSRWEVMGVPAAWQPAVTELLRVALALRRQLPSSTTARLLTLRQRRATERDQLKRIAYEATDLSGHLVLRHFVVTTRR
jgi:precorrin-4 methylase